MAKDLFYEIGTEEIPARFINNALSEIETILKKDLDSLRISYDQIKTYATPRRFAIQIQNIAEKQSDYEELVKGPAKKIALDSSGSPSKALLGFVKSKNGEIENVEFIDINGEEYAHLRLFSQGKETKVFVKDILENVIRNINFPKPMKWGNKNIKFVRPIRWLISILGDEVVEFNIEGIPSSNITKGHRFLGKSEIKVKNFTDYEQKLKDNYVILDHNKRREIIKQQVQEVAYGLKGEAIVVEEILDEVNFIVEYPTAFYGSFDEEYLKLPKEVVITPMQNHQRYFPVIDSTGELMNYFITIRNGDSFKIDNVRKGNQKVLDARLKDALFFFQEDTKKPLEEYVENLETIVFHQKLGTMREKVERIRKSSLKIAADLGFNTDHIDRSALLAKADLTTQMVFEFGELQGIMGRHYALLSNECNEVAQGIYEHYLPRNAEDSVASGTEGICISLADKMDTIAGFFSIGIQPTGSQDPYALRRQSIGILSTMIENELSLGVEDLVRISCAQYKSEISEEIITNITTFMMLRLNYILLDRGIRYDIVNSVANHRNLPPYIILKIAKSIEKWLQIDKSDVLTTFLRGNNLVKSLPAGKVDTSVFEHQSENALYNSIIQVEDKVEALISSCEYYEALCATESIVPQINELFDNVMIMHENLKVRENRLSLVKYALNSIMKILDIEQISFK